MTLETPVETFKRATALAIKAIGHKAELEVGFTTEPMGVTGSRVKIPLPSAGLPQGEVEFHSRRCGFRRFAPALSQSENPCEASARQRRRANGVRSAGAGAM